MNVSFSDRAHREMERIDAAWRAQADSPELFLDELLEAVHLVETTGVLGTPYPVTAQRPVTRLLMKRSGYHVYLAQSSEEEVVIVSIWSARRARGPKL